MPVGCTMRKEISRKGIDPVVVAPATPFSEKLLIAFHALPSRSTGGNEKGKQKQQGETERRKWSGIRKIETKKWSCRRKPVKGSKWPEKRKTRRFAGLDTYAAPPWPWNDIVSANKIVSRGIRRSIGNASRSQGKRDKCLKSNAQPLRFVVERSRVLNVCERDWRVK